MSAIDVRVVDDPKQIEEIFPEIRRWIENAIGVDKGYLPDDIKEECKNKKWKLELIYKDNILMGFFISRIVVLPQTKLLYGAWLGGRDLDKWVKEGIQVVISNAKKDGCGSFSFIGRSAWKKLVGFDYHGMFFYKNL